VSSIPHTPVKKNTKARYTEVFPSILLILTALILQVSPLQAQQKQSGDFVPPPGGAPRKTIGAGTRTDESACLGSSTATPGEITLFSPSSYIGLTTSDRPTFLFQLPPTKAKTLELSLFDEKMQSLYQTIVPAVNSPSGIIALKLPETAPSLQSKKIYYWAVAIICNPSDRTEDLSKSAAIEYTEPSAELKKLLAKATPIQQIDLYAKNGFWYESITRLFELQQTEPKSPGLNQAWVDSLKSVGIDIPKP